MVQILSPLFLFASLVALTTTTTTVAASEPAKRSAADIETAIAGIATQLTTIDNALNALLGSGVTLVQALAIHTDTVAFETSVEKGATVVVSTITPVSETDGLVIVHAVQALVPTLLDVLHAFVLKSPAFKALPIGGVPALVLQDITRLRSDVVAFLNALIGVLPADLQVDILNILDILNPIFATTIAAY